MKKTALVTGASGGIGEAIAQRLVDMDYEVYGVGRCYDKCMVDSEFFHPLVCDLLDEKQLDSLAEKMNRIGIDVLVNNAGTAYYGMHEEISPQHIRTILRTNLEVPMILCQKMIRMLRKRKGTIISISSVTALGSSPHGAAYGASKAGLLHFTRTLFDENRKSGMKTAVIMPDMTVTGLYRNADFTADETEGCSLVPSDAADAVQYILEARSGVCVNEIVLRPQLHRIRRRSKTEEI